MEACAVTIVGALVSNLRSPHGRTADPEPHPDRTHEAFSGGEDLAAIGGLPAPLDLVVSPNLRSFTTKILFFIRTSEPLYRSKSFSLSVPSADSRG